ncbi:TRAP transporter small permease subunit [Chloroflexota bacterium]
MPKALVVFVRSVDKMSGWLGKVLSYLLLFIITIMLIEAVLRYAFDAPTLWSMEMSSFTFGAYVILGGAYVLRNGGHVNMDIMYNRWSPRTRTIVNVITFALLAIYAVTFIRGGISSTDFSFTFNVTSRSPWAPPLGPIKLIVTVGAGLLLLQGVAILIRDLATLKGKKI